MEATLLTPEEVRLVAAKFYNQTAQRADGLMDMFQLMTLIYEMLKVDAPEWIFVPAFPKYLRPETEEWKKTMQDPTALYRPTITWTIERMEPAAIGGNKEPFGTGTKQLTPRPWAKRAGIGNTQDTIFVQQYDVMVRFDMWLITNFEAEQSAQWFRQYLMDRRSFFIKRGVENFLFWKRVDDPAIRPHNNGLEVRPLTFFVRTQEISVESAEILRNLELSITVT